MAPQCGTTAFGTAVGVGAVLAGSPVFVIVRVLRHHTVFQQVLLRSPFFLGAGTIAAVFRWGLSKSNAGRFKGAVYSFGWIGVVGSFFLAAQSLAIVMSLLLTKMSNVAFIINTSPVFCGIVDTFVLRERLPLRTKAMMFMGLASVVIILWSDFDANPDYTVGNLVALINPISWAIFWAIMRQNKDDNSQTHKDNAHGKKWDDLLLVQLVSGCFIAIAGVIGTLSDSNATWSRSISAIHTNSTSSANATSHLDTGISTSDWGIYFLFGGVVLPITCLLFSSAPIFISTTLMGCIKQLEMVLIPVYGYLYDGEIPQTEAILGALLLLVTLLTHSILQWLDKSHNLGNASSKPPSEREDSDVDVSIEL